MMILAPKPIVYDPQIIRRAMIAFVSAPLQWSLLAAMRDNSVPLPDIAGVQGHQAGYTTKILSETSVEYYLMWLIQVGMLRREVDGQGITDSFRLTPIGRQILEDWQEKCTCDRISMLERLRNDVGCWLNRFSL